MDNIVKKHNEFVNKTVEVLIPLHENAMQILEDKFGLRTPLLE